MKQIQAYVWLIVAAALIALSVFGYFHYQSKLEQIKTLNDDVSAKDTLIGEKNQTILQLKTTADDNRDALEKLKKEHQDITSAQADLAKSNKALSTELTAAEAELKEWAEKNEINDACINSDMPDHVIRMLDHATGRATN